MSEGILLNSLVYRGTKKIKYLEENLHALKITLTPEETAEIRKKVEVADVHGLRYPDR
jgi:aryl-alcohol dehydrogenase-like predicted oxidoreductase